MSNNDPGYYPQFGKLREFFWPIHNFELKKFMPMSLMLFCIIFNYTVLRDAKDTLVVNAAIGGAELLPFLKGFVVLPCSILFVVVYSRLSNSFSRNALFYGMVLFFISFFALFKFYLYPHQASIHPSAESIIALQAHFPNFKYFFPLYGLWSYSLLYLFAELWGAIMISFMFWQFANEVTRIFEAKRFYTLFGFIGAFATFFAGALLVYNNEIQHMDFNSSLNLMLSFVTVSGLIIMGLYYWINRYVLTDPFYYDEASALKKHKEKKPKLSLVESFKYIVSSKYLGYMAILVIAYGICVGLVEVIWKSQVKEMFADQQKYYSFMGSLSMAVSIGNIILVFPFKSILRRFGWYAGAISTPLMLGVTSLIFFIVFLFPDFFNPYFTYFGLTPILVIVSIGTVQNIFIKSAKYSLFDPTKEMAYIPLDQELKIKGKAAVDIIGGRFGKGSSGYINSFLLTITAGTAATIAPFVGITIFILIGFWMISVKNLNKLYHEATLKQETDKLKTLDEKPRKSR